jgi:hypothetical protein
MKRIYSDYQLMDPGGSADPAAAAAAAFDPTAAFDYAHMAAAAAEAAAAAGGGGGGSGRVRQPKQYQQHAGSDGKIKACLQCGTTRTPQWREGPYGPKTL